MRFVDRSSALSTSDVEERLCAPDDDIVELEFVDEEETEEELEDDNDEVEEAEVFVEDEDGEFVCVFEFVDGTQCEVGDVAELVGVLH